MARLLERVDLRGMDLTSPVVIRQSVLGRAAPVQPGDAELAARVADIVARVAEEGDEALLALGERFDGVRPERLRVDPADVQASLSEVPLEVSRALEAAYERITEYHRHQLPRPAEVIVGGVSISEMVVPVERAGIYAPGGRGAYPSTVLMCAAPARIAGVGGLALCAPPDGTGRVAAVTLAACAIAGVEEVYCAGGAQAIAAMALGTETVPPVDVVVGPGNRYVAEAKRQLAGRVGVPAAYAGPSEVVVVADDSVPPRFAAVDLMVQAEHGPDGVAWLVAWSEAVADAVEEELALLVPTSSRRAELEATLAGGGYSVLVDSPEAAIAVTNELAPEHLEILVERADEQARLLSLVRRAGAVFLGPYAPASLGDYMAGTNHVLPTARTARFSSALRVDDFCRRIHAVSASKEALSSASAAVATLALAEGLPSHAMSVEVRTGPVTDRPPEDRARALDSVTRPDGRTPR
jgi:histidinol dehydrogenase